MIRRIIVVLKQSTFGISLQVVVPIRNTKVRKATHHLSLAAGIFITVEYVRRIKTNACLL